MAVPGSAAYVAAGLLKRLREAKDWLVRQLALRALAPAKGARSIGHNAHHRPGAHRVAPPAPPAPRRPR